MAYPQAFNAAQQIPRVGRRVQPGFTPTPNLIRPTTVPQGTSQWPSAPTPASGPLTPTPTQPIPSGSPASAPLTPTPQLITPVTQTNGTSEYPSVGGPLQSTPGLVKPLTPKEIPSYTPPTSIPNSTPSAVANVNVPGASVTPYGPGNDLRGGMITPGAGPSRSQIAQERLAAFDTAAQPQIRDQIQAVGQKAAAFGRLGMGDTAVETLRPYTDYLTQRESLSHSLAADTAEGEIGDQSSQRGELRTERGFQDEMARRAMDNAFRQRGMESGEYDTEYNRRLQEIALEAGVDPTAVFLGAAGNRSQSAGQDWSGAAAAFQAWLSKQNGGAQ